MQKPNDRDLTGSDVIFACNFQSLAGQEGLHDPTKSDF